MPGVCSRPGRDQMTLAVTVAVMAVHVQRPNPTLIDSRICSGIGHGLR